jgi:hypothetical protein
VFALLELTSDLPFTSVSEEMVDEDSLLFSLVSE